jgi:hypothetical protein
MNNSRKPDFICIGPERTATSSLYLFLDSHPEFHMVPQKEIRYWNEGNLIPGHSAAGVILSGHWHYRHIRKSLLRHVAKAVLGRVPPSEVGWYLRYAFGRRSRLWYHSLFENGENLITGDISPLYYHLPEPAVREIAEYNSSIKIIMIIRDPVARTWSKVRMNLLRHRGRSFREVPEREFYQAFDRIRDEWVPYLETASIWKDYFSEVHLGFFDDLREDSGRFFSDILSFLGAEDIDSFSLPDRKANRGLPVRMPELFRSYLAEQYREEITALSETVYGEYARRWLNRCGL